MTKLLNLSGNNIVSDKYFCREIVYFRHKSVCAQKKCQIFPPHLSATKISNSLGKVSRKLALLTTSKISSVKVTFSDKSRICPKFFVTKSTFSCNVYNYIMENSTVPLWYLPKKRFWPLDEDGSIWTVQLAYVFLKNLKIYKKNKSRLSVTWFPASIFLNLV